MVWDAAGAGDVHVDQVLTNISVGWLTDIADVASVLFPGVPVSKQTDKYYVFGRETWQPEPWGDLRAPGQPAVEIPGMKLSTDSYYTQEHALAHPVTPEERSNADSPLNPDTEAVELVTSKIVLGRELAAREIAHNEDNYLAEHVTTLSGGDQFNDYDNSEPMDVFRDAKRTFHSNMFVTPNVAVLPWLVMHWLEDHPEFRERIKYTQAATPSRDVVASMLGIDRIVVPGQGYDKANPGQSMDLDYLWLNHVILAWVPPNPGLKMPSFGYEFVWRPHGVDQYSDRWWSNERKADIIRVGRNYDLKLIAKDEDQEKSLAGYLIKDAVDPEAS